MKWRYPDKPIETSPDFIAGLRENEWISQSKYDGWRGPVYTDESQVGHLFSSSGRRMENVTKVPQELQCHIAELSLTLPPLSVVDAEFVGPRGGHAPRLFMFDILAWNGVWQVKVQYEKRWEMLQSCCRNDWADILLAETVESDFLGHFNRLKKIWYDGGCSKLDLHEGIVLKRKTGLPTLSLNSSSKSRHLYKIKYRDVREKRW